MINETTSHGLFGMTIGETTANIIALLALIVAGIAAWRTSKENIRANVIREIQAAAASTSANAAQSHAAATLTLVELEVQKMIDAAKNRLAEFTAEHAELFTRDEASLKPNQVRERAALEQTLKQIVEGYLVVMDGACTRYETGHVRKEWFEREYRSDIRNIVEGEYEDILSKAGHPYKTLMRVYHQWEDPKPS
jgi:hypothetical protein